MPGIHARRIARIVSSTETKAIETTEILATHLELPVEVRPGTGENDRGATGIVPPEAFEDLADAFFADPHTSVRGWERAIDAQQRIVKGLDDLLAPRNHVAVIGHGGVGTLWYCHLTGVPIDRCHDQLGHVRLPDSHPRAPERTCEIHGYAIDHPDGVVVVDTGPRLGHPIIDDLYAPRSSRSSTPSTPQTSTTEKSRR